VARCQVTKNQDALEADYVVLGGEHQEIEDLPDGAR